jgi:hypothetical protein
MHVGRATCRIHIGAGWIEWYHYVMFALVMVACAGGMYALCDYCGQCGGDHMELCVTLSNRFPTTTPVAPAASDPIDSRRHARCV